MEQKIALVNCLALLHLENLQSESGTYKSLIKKTTDLIRVPDMVSEGDGYSALSGVRRVVTDLSSGEIEFDITTVLQKIRVYCSLDQSFYQSIKEAMEISYESEKDIRKAISANISHLHHFNNSSEFRKLISKASFTINNDTGADYKTVAAALQDEIAKVTKNANVGESGTLVASVGTVNRDGMAEIFENTKKQLNGNTLKTGWRGLNRMLGINGGFVPGELCLMPALPHEGKTLFSMLTFISLAVFNDPKNFLPEGKEHLKPMLLDLSFENELEVNLPIAYRALKENTDKVSVNIMDIDSKEAADYICDTLLNEHGWHYQFERHINSDFTIANMRERMAYYEGLGYHIVGIRADYLGTINRAGLGNGTIGSDIRELYRIARNLTSPKKCLLLAPHQLSPKAKELKSMDPLKYVRMLPGKGMYDGCTTIDNEADLELYFGITKVDDRSYLEVQRGKHRTLVDTPMAHRYRVFPFNDIGTLPWDLDGDLDLSLKSVNADAMANESDDVFGFGNM